MATSGGPKVISNGLVGQIDAGAINNTDFGGPASRTGYLQTGQLGQTFYVETDVSMSASPYNFEFGGDKNTRIQISGANGDFASTTGPFDLPNFDGYTIEVVFMRTDFGTWATGGGTYYDGIWNYYWNHYLAFRGQNYTGNKIYGTGLSDYDIEMDRYYNVCMTHNNSDGAHKIYIDGNLQQSSTQSNPTLSSGNIRRFYVGNWDSGWSCVGRIPLIRVYNRVLSTEEVTQNFNATKERFGI
jgi:hypothetical protein